MSNYDIDIVLLIETAHAKFSPIADAITDATKDAMIYVGDGGESDIQLAQINLWRWQRRNFGLPTYTMYACGVLEECAEFSAALDIEDTAARRTAQVDAFGDICIYSCNFATALELDFETLFANGLANFNGRTRQLCHAALKSEQKIRGYDDRAKGRLELGHALASYVGQYTHRLMICFEDARPEEAFLATVQHVTKRDWKKDPVHAGEVA